MLTNVSMQHRSFLELSFSQVLSNWFYTFSFSHNFVLHKFHSYLLSLFSRWSHRLNLEDHFLHLTMPLLPAVPHLWTEMWLFYARLQKTQKCHFVSQADQWCWQPERSNVFQAGTQKGDHCHCPHCRNCNSVKKKNIYHLLIFYITLVIWCHFFLTMFFLQIQTILPISNLWSVFQVTHIIQFLRPTTSAPHTLWTLKRRALLSYYRYQKHE